MKGIDNVLICLLLISVLGCSQQVNAPDPQASAEASAIVQRLSAMPPAERGAYLGAHPEEAKKVMDSGDPAQINALGQLIQETHNPG